MNAPRRPTEEEVQELVALIWALKPSDFSALPQLVKQTEEAMQMTTADSGNAIFYERLIQIGLATERNPFEGTSLPPEAAERMKNQRGYVLNELGKALIERAIPVALTTGWPPHGAILTPTVMKLLEHYANADSNMHRGQSMSKLATAHQSGKGVPKNPDEAMRLYFEAAELGDPTAFNNLGVAYYKGDGAPRDFAKSFEYFKKAADQGSLGAIDNIGNMYARGEGVTQSDAEAARWYRRAAEAGRPTAMCNLADFYVKGRGVEQDDMQAYIWYSLGIRGGLDARQPRDALAARMKPEQVQEANDFIASWKPVKEVKG